MDCGFGGRYFRPSQPQIFHVCHQKLHMDFSAIQSMVMHFDCSNGLPPITCSVKAAVAATGLGKDKNYTMMNDGRLESATIRGRRLVFVDSLEAHLEACERREMGLDAHSNSSLESLHNSGFLNYRTRYCHDRYDQMISPGRYKRSPHRVRAKYAGHSGEVVARTREGRGSIHCGCWSFASIQYARLS